MLNALEVRVATSIRAFPGWHLPLAIGRSIIAIAQMSLLLFTPAAALFLPIANGQTPSPCSRPLLVVSPYCWFPEDRDVVSWGLVLLLIWVASGLLPQISGLVHFWISFCIAQTISLPDGGDYVAQVVTLFLAFVSLAHGRLWYWQRASSTSRLRVPIAVGAMWVVRLQVAWIYLNSGLSKLPVPEWQEGSAVYYVMRMEWFGSGGLLSELFLGSTAVPLISLVVTWGTIIGECAIAVLVLGRGRLPALAFVISALLHSSIIVGLGLFSFGSIMIGAVMCAAAPGIVPAFSVARSLRRSASTAGEARPVVPVASGSS